MTVAASAVTRARRAPPCSKRTCRRFVARSPGRRARCPARASRALRATSRRPVAPATTTTATRNVPAPPESPRARRGMRVRRARVQPSRGERRTSVGQARRRVPGVGGLRQYDSPDLDFCSVSQGLARAAQSPSKSIVVADFDTTEKIVVEVFSRPPMSELVGVGDGEGDVPGDGTRGRSRRTRRSHPVSLRRFAKIRARRGGCGARGGRQQW